MNAIESPSRRAGRSPGSPGRHRRAHAAVAVSGWFGVVVLAACGYGVYLAGGHAPGSSGCRCCVFAAGRHLAGRRAAGQTSVVQFFGSYVGTVRRPGFWWVLPLTVRRRVSVRVRNFETNRLKVNDADGNPVDIAAIVVWQVADTAKSTYAVDNYQDFVSVQAESALRHVATTHSYDDADGDRDLAARLDRRRGRGARPRGGRAGRHRRGRDRRGPHLAPGLRPGDRPGDAAPPAGQRGRRGPHPDRRGRGRHGGARPEPARRERRGRARRGAQGQHGQQPDGRAVRRPAAVARSSTPARCTREPTRRQVLLRVDPAVHDALMRWANDEFRASTRAGRSTTPSTGRSVMR